MPDADSPADVAALRDLFLLRPDVVFLNHGAFGACPRPVMDEYQRWQVELEREPVDFLARRLDERLAWARGALAAYVGAAADDLVFVPNSTTALNIVARSLALRPGDEVLITDHEYGALERTWRFICERRGAALVQAPVAVPLASSSDVVEAIWRRVTDRTRVLFASHITSPTALIFPLGEVISRARAAGILTVIDGAHAPGQIALDLAALGPDVYAGNCHKWMCAPKGSAFLHVRPEAQPLVQPLVVSWGWPSSFIKEQQWQGTRDVAAFLAVPAAIEFQRAHDWPAVQARCHRLLRSTRRALLEMTGLPPLCPDAPEWFRQMASVAVPGAPEDAEALLKRLRDECSVDAPLVPWGDRLLLRVSIQGYNSPADVEALLAAVRHVLPVGRRAEA